DSDPADLLLCGDLQPHVRAPLCQVSGNARIRHPRPGAGRRLRALHRRRRRARQRGAAGLETAGLIRAVLVGYECTKNVQVWFRVFVFSWKVALEDCTTTVSTDPGI